ncbi:MAG TPA: alpha/beta hydrolase [Candidatus Dormibacteraeota bacterium]|nr:alpha/beta hydrolase [Candidatus Dormibacteraeota bacterium]
MFRRGNTRNAQPKRSALVLDRLDINDLHFADEMAAGLEVDLPGRGAAFVRVSEGPKGAPTVLLVHGLLATADLNWSLAMPALASRFRVVAPDLRGHGRGLPTRRFTGSECADDLAAIVKVLDLGPVIVVGYSIGGLVAQLFARRYPELVVGMVLCATACSFDVPTKKPVIRLVERAARRAPERLRRAALMAMLAPRSANCARGRWLMAEVRLHDTIAILDATAEAGRFNSAAWLGESACPAAVIVTSEDPVVSAASQREMSKALVGSAVYEVAGDHFACIKRPVEFNAALMSACVGLGS